MRIIGRIDDPVLAPYETLWRKQKQRGVLVCEGLRGVELALGSRRISPRLCLLTEACYARRDARLEALLAGLPPGCSAQLISERLMKRFAATKSPQGIVLIASRAESADAGAFLAARREGALRLIVLEAVQDPGNVGSIVRSAEAFGFDALIYDPDCADPYGPKALRASMGSAFFIDLIFCAERADLRARLAEAGLLRVGGALDGAALEDGGFGPRVALYIGNEASGLRPETLAELDARVRIPMRGRAESLNAAAAAAILAYKISEV